MLSRLLMVFAVLLVIVAGIEFVRSRSFTVIPDLNQDEELADTFQNYSVPARLLAGGKPVGTLIKGQELTVPIAGVPRDDVGVPVLEAEMHTPCGWRRVETRTRKQSGLPVVFTVHYDLAVSPTVKRRLDVGYDNRGGGPATVKIGELEFPIAANASGTLHLSADGCNGEADVRLNDAALGKMSFGQALEEGDADVLVLDVSGGHCYAASEVDYGSGTEPRHQGPQRQVRVYQTHGPNFHFLESPADSVKGLPTTRTTESGASVVTVLWMWDEPCEDSSQQ
jgi:hypothetical protein